MSWDVGSATNLGGGNDGPERVEQRRRAVTDLARARFDVDAPALVVGIVEVDEKLGGTRADQLLRRSPATVREVRPAR